jgi:hypothetical protein
MAAPPIAVCWLCHKPAPVEELKEDEFGFFAHEYCLKAEANNLPLSASA